MDTAEIIYYPERNPYVTLYINGEFEDIFDNTSKNYMDAHAFALAVLKRKYKEVEFVKTYTNARGYDVDVYECE